MNSESNREDLDTSKVQESISLVEPATLALRLAYLVAAFQEKEIFFKTTRKRLEKLAIYKEISNQTGSQSKTTFKDKAPITEAYIDCCRYELERLAFTLIRVDKEYLICATEDLRQVKRLDHDNESVYSLADNVLKAEVDSFFASRQKSTKAPSKDKTVTEDKQLVLQDIWAKLIDHVKANCSQSALATLTYQGLTSKLDYKVHRNGLASFLFSIERYCVEKGLPKLNYWVVKEGTGLPDGLKATVSQEVVAFNDELKEITEYIANDLFTLSPVDLKYVHKARPKRARKGGV